MSLVNATTGEVFAPGPLSGELSLTGYVLPEGLTYEEWAAEGTLLVTMARASMWWVGDWIRYGERRYGETYAQAIEATGLAYDTLKAAVWTCDRIEMVRRRTNLAFSHHRAAAALEPVQQDEVLDLAVAEGWTEREIRAEVKRRKNGFRPKLIECADLYADVDVFSTVVIDPPWQYDNKATRGAAEDHYPTMPVEELCELDLSAADDAHLYLWVTNAFMREAFVLLDAWGFKYKTLLTWCKPQIGLGNYFRNSTEHVLFAVRGSLATQRNDVPTWFVADRKRHSAKPESFYDLVESSSPGPYLEWFARRRRMGWHVKGNEA